MAPRARLVAVLGLVVAIVLGGGVVVAVFASVTAFQGQADLTDGGASACLKAYLKAHPSPRVDWMGDPRFAGQDTLLVAVHTASDGAAAGTPSSGRLRCTLTEESGPGHTILVVHHVVLEADPS
jgi:hypothetical protein